MLSYQYERYIQQKGAVKQAISGRCVLHHRYDLEQNQEYCSLISLVEGRRFLMIAST